MADRADDMSFDPKTWVDKTGTPAVAPAAVAPAPAIRAAGDRTGLAIGLSALLLLTAAGAAYLTRAPVVAAPAALR